MNIRTKQTWAVILSIGGSIGTIATAFLVRKAAKKEVEIRDSIFRSDYESKQVTPPKHVFRQIAPVYIPALVAGVATVVSTISSTILSKRAEASITAMALLADQGWRKYKDTAKEVLGIDKHVDILKGISKKEPQPIVKPEDTRKLYFEEHVGYFLADPERLALSYGDINQRLQIEQYGESSYYAMLYNFLKQADAELLDKDVEPESLQWGWSAEYLQEMHGYQWIHMSYHKETDSDGREYTIIEWGEEPILNPGEWGAVFAYSDTPADEGSFMPVMPEGKDIL